MPANSRRSQPSFTPRVVMCAVDFSKNAALALRVSADLARRTGARLLVAHVHDPLLAAGAATQQFDLEADTQSEVRKLLRRHIPDLQNWAERPEIVTTIAPISDGVLQLAKAHRADVVVMGTQGLTGYRKAFFGSTVDRVMRQIEVPLIAVPPRMRHRSTGSLEAGPVVVAVDFSAGSRQAVRLGASLARLLGVDLKLVHVLEPVPVLPRWQRSATLGEAARAADAETALQRLADPLGDLVIERALARGTAPETIAKFARRCNASVIATGAHRGGQQLSRVVGSTAYRIACLSTVPILVVPVSVA